MEILDILQSYFGKGDGGHGGNRGKKQNSGMRMSLVPSDEEFIL